MHSRGGVLKTHTSPAPITRIRFRLEPATTTVFVLTSAVTAVSLFVPSVLPALMRTPAALAGEGWRIVTPLFVERGGAGEITLNLLTLAVVGTLVERVWGSRAWVVFYAFGGIVGEIAGLAWKPIGAGSSVAILGLLGGAATWLLRYRPSRLFVALGVLLLVAGAVLTFVRNLHGPPLLAEALAACFMLTRAERNPRAS
jgi:membrane associated rhomboid family serine protease